ncbi:MAG: DUF2911 domain-containing protein [Acidobacteria bacterium]|nr:DUF2911 domain-containing protein [Acidobacteriota bacterium]
MKLIQYSLLMTLMLFTAVTAYAQVTIPRESNYQEISQVIGDTKVTITYHRPNTKGRQLWGGLVPYGEVWRTGANNATTFDISNDITVNGQALKKGKYSIHSLPTDGDWQIIFNKVSDQWGSFTYDEKQDVLRVAASPVKAEFRETMSITFENVVGNKADVNVRWGDLAVPFTIEVGDFKTRFVSDHVRRTNAERMTLANFVLSEKMTASYGDALSWVEGVEKTSKTFGVLSLKARLLNELGRKADAIKTGEEAISIGKAATPAANTTALENMVKAWKEGK